MFLHSRFEGINNATYGVSSTCLMTVYDGGAGMILRR